PLRSCLIPWRQLRSSVALRRPSCWRLRHSLAFRLRQKNRAKFVMAKSKKSSSKPAKAKARAKLAKTKAKKSGKKKPAARPTGLVPQAKPDARRRLAKLLIRRAAEGVMRAAPRLQPRLHAGKYDADLERHAANYQALTPLSFLERAASVFPNHTAIIHGTQRFSYADYYARSRRLASALSKAGLRKADTVAVMLANTPPMLEAHYGVPMAGGV